MLISSHMQSCFHHDTCSSIVHVACMFMQCAYFYVSPLCSAAVENVPRMSASRIKCVAIIITPSLGHTNDADRSMLVHQHRIIKIFDGIHLTRTFEIAKLQDYDGLTTTWLQDELHKVLQIDSIMIRIIRAYSGESTQNGMDFQRVYLERHATVGTLQEILQERFKIAVTQQRITRVTSAFVSKCASCIHIITSH